MTSSTTKSTAKVDRIAATEVDSRYPDTGSYDPWSKRYPKAKHTYMEPGSSYGGEASNYGGTKAWSSGHTIRGFWHEGSKEYGQNTEYWLNRNGKEEKLMVPFYCETTNDGTNVYEGEDAVSRLATLKATIG